jgi:hypothetical protein
VICKSVRVALSTYGRVIIHRRELLWVLQVVGSNPAAPTIIIKYLAKSTSPRKSAGGRPGEGNLQAPSCTGLARSVLSSERFRKAHVMGSFSRITVLRVFSRSALGKPHPSVMPCWNRLSWRGMIGLFCFALAVLASPCRSKLRLEAV